MIAINTPYGQHFELSGDPLDAGYLYFGEAGEDPETNPITVYWDEDGTIPAAQPIRTSNGYAIRDGVQALVYSSIDYSVRARNKKLAQVFYLPNSAEFSFSSALVAVQQSLTTYGIFGYDPRTTYPNGTAGANFSETISIGALSRVGLSDTEAFTAANTLAHARILTNSPLQSFGVAIHVPGTKNWDLNGLAAALPITKNGISYFGDPGSGGRIVRNGLIFDVDDPTNTFRVTMFGLRDIMLDAGVGNNSTAAVRLRRTQEARFTNVTTVNFNIHYDLYRASTSRFNLLRLDNSSRTTNGQSFFRFQGLDESAFTVPTEYTPGGGAHFNDIEVHHDNASFYTNACFEVKSVDGLYVAQVHCTGCAHMFEVVPDATPANYVITDVHATECYFDNPPAMISPTLVSGYHLAGSVNPTITIASLAVKKSIYQNLWFLQCYARCAHAALFGALVEVGDPGGAFFAAGETVQDIKFHGGEYAGAYQTGIRVKGASSGAFFEIDGLDIVGATIGDNNFSAAANVGSGVNAEISSGTIRANTFKADDGATSYIVRLILTNAGSVDDAGAALASVNSFTGTTATVQDIFYTAAAGAKVEISNNLPSGPGQGISQRYSGRTDDRAVKILWQQAVQDGQMIEVEARTVGSSVSGTLGAERARYYQRLTVYRTAGTTTVQTSSDIVAYENVTNNDSPVNLVVLTGTAWVASAATAARAFVTSGGRLYMALLAGNLDAATAPTHTASVVTNGTVPLAYVGSVATNTMALIVSGAAATDMSWASKVDALIVP